MRCAGFPGVVPVGWGAESAWRGFGPVLVGCGVPCPRVGEGGAVWYGGVVLCGGRPGGGGGFGLVWVKACAGRPGPQSALAFVPTRLG